MTATITAPACLEGTGWGRRPAVPAAPLPAADAQGLPQACHRLWAASPPRQRAVPRGQTGLQPRAMQAAGLAPDHGCACLQQGAGGTLPNMPQAPRTQHAPLACDHAPEAAVEVEALVAGVDDIGGVVGGAGDDLRTGGASLGVSHMGRTHTHHHTVQQCTGGHGGRHPCRAGAGAQPAAPPTRLDAGQALQLDPGACGVHVVHSIAAGGHRGGTAPACVRVRRVGSCRTEPQAGMQGSGGALRRGTHARTCAAHAVAGSGLGRDAPQATRLPHAHQLGCGRGRGGAGRE